jgi:hypothetical protein
MFEQFGMKYLSLDDKGRILQVDFHTKYVANRRINKGQRPTDAAIEKLRPAGLSSKYGKVIT